MTEGLHVQVKRNFSRILKSAREAAGYRHATTFANLIGVEPPTYRHWERGHALPDMTGLIKICMHLDLSLDEVLMASVKKTYKKPQRLQAIG